MNSGRPDLNPIGPDFALVQEKKIMDRNEEIKEMNDLHELMADSRKGYNEAAKKVDSPELAQFLQRLSAQRDSMQTELAAEIRRFKPDDRLKDGTAKGTLHRAWMDIREALGSSDDVNMLDECERGEKYLVERFDTVLGTAGIAPTSKQLLSIQRQQVQENLTEVKGLRETLKAVAK